MNCSKNRTTLNIFGILSYIEYDNLFSTKNLYNLPTAYNYGIGSTTGLGVFRELVTHLKTTHWVLEGAMATFPLMYHYRILPSTKACADLEINIEHRGNHANFKKYVLDRANAQYELVLFLEYVPIRSLCARNMVAREPQQTSATPQ